MSASDPIFTRELETHVTHQETLLLVGDDGQVTRFTTSNTSVTEKAELHTIDQKTVDGFIAQEEAKLVDTSNMLERGHKVGLVVGIGGAAISFFNKIGDYAFAENTLFSLAIGSVLYGLVGQALPRAERMRIAPSNDQRLRRINQLRSIPVDPDNL